MRVINDTSKGAALSGLSQRLEVTEQFAKVFFKTGEWNAIVRAGLFAGGEKWRYDYLPLRFTNYARNVMHYRSKSSDAPVASGRLRADALENSSTEARVTKSSAMLILHISTPIMRDHKGVSTGQGYSANVVVYDLLSSITAREVEVIAKKCEETMLGLIEGASVNVTRKGTVVGKLTQTQKSSLSHTKRPQAGARTRRAA